MNSVLPPAFAALLLPLFSIQSPLAPADGKLHKVESAAPIVSGELGAKLDRYLTDSKYSGNALVLKDGKPLLMKGYGEADHEQHVPFTTETLVSIGSITKQFTAAAILKLEMEGKLKVEDPITRFFTTVPEDKRAITLHQLLTHTAGLESDFAGDYEAVTRDEYVKRILDSKLRTPPGAEHFYANSGYSLLGAIVEIASKEPYEQYLRAHLFEAAGMHDTGYRLPKWDKTRVPVGYRDGKRWGTMFEKAWAEDGPYWALRANGGIESTLEDLGKWSRALDGSAVLSESAKKKLFTPHVLESPGGDSYYGYGWAISKSAWGSRLIAHDGGNGVFSADLRRYVDDGIVVITAASDSRIKAFRYSGRLARIAHGEEVAPDRPEERKLTTLGDSPRHAVIKQFVEAFNTKDLARMQKFRAEHMLKRPDGPSDEERDRMTKEMFENLESLSVEGVLAEEDESVTVRMRVRGSEPGRFRFLFTPEAKVTGVSIEMGD